MLLNDSWKVPVCPPSKLDEIGEVNDEVDKDLEKEKVVKEVEKEVEKEEKEVDLDDSWKVPVCPLIASSLLPASPAQSHYQLRLGNFPGKLVQITSEGNWPEI